MTRAAFSDLGTALLICLAGGVGAALRLVIDSLIRTRLKSTYPVGTAVINLTGSLLLGLLTGLTTRPSRAPAISADHRHRPARRLHHLQRGKR